MVVVTRRVKLIDTCIIALVHLKLSKRLPRKLLTLSSQINTGTRNMTRRIWCKILNIHGVIVIHEDVHVCVMLLLHPMNLNLAENWIPKLRSWLQQELMKPCLLPLLVT